MKLCFDVGVIRSVEIIVFSFETFTILETKGSRLSENIYGESNEKKVSKMCPVTLLNSCRSTTSCADYLCKIGYHSSLERSSIDFMADRSVNDD